MYDVNIVYFYVSEDDFFVFYKLVGVSFYSEECVGFVVFVE